MRILAIISLGIIAAVLFYKFVDDRHKTSLFKSAFWSGISIAIFIAGIMVWDEYSMNQAKTYATARTVDQAADGSSITFEICNTKNVSLQAVTIHASGFRPGRSNPQPVVEQGNSQQFSELYSDQIIAAGKCEEAEIRKVPGHFVIFERHTATIYQARWEDGSSVYLPD
ncbi:MAG: hypothetical protein CMP10_21895 [Zetaproteobacteria bacterium]|nr:hypothetical protein [Pseudobdellovibrionaceae bacterium]|tara:strand:- start:282 stop:788 length:507 start_codon:yes stop_codon:yes gene_type:complete